MAWSVSQLAQAIRDSEPQGQPLELRVIGDGSTRIEALGSLTQASRVSLGYAIGPQFRQSLLSSQAGCAIVSPALEDAATHLPSAMVCADPLRAFAALTRWWVQQGAPAAAGVHASAVIDPSVKLGRDVTVAALAVIEAGAVIGDAAFIGPHSFIGAGAQIGAQTRVLARAVINHGCIVGARCIFHPGSVVGADGFGFAPHQGRWERIEQLGRVRVGDDVELGANSCVDRGALDDTVLEDGVKIDNLVQIGHNCHIGAHTAMAACVGIAGSTRIGQHVTIGGAAMIVGHITIADHVHISGGTLISRSLTKAGHYSGSFPFDDHAAWEKNAATLRQLHTLRERIRTLEKQVKS